MHKLLLVVATITAAISLYGCSHRPVQHADFRSEASLSRVAVARANEEAKRGYHVEPFGTDDGTLRREGDGWVWQALASLGQADLLARVTFDMNGSVTGVDVQMMSHPGPSVPQPFLPGSADDLLHSPLKRPFGPPEIVPE